MAQPQKNHYSSGFNLRDADVMLESQRILHGEVFSVSFSVTDIDGMFCDPEYVKKSYKVSLGGNQKVLTKIRIIIQKM